MKFILNTANKKNGFLMKIVEDIDFEVHDVDMSSWELTDSPKRSTFSIIVEFLTRELNLIYRHFVSKG
jgi:hypothetical protein